MWVSHRSGSTGEPLTPEQVRQWHRRMAPPENELPAGVGVTVLLGRTDDVAVGLTQVEAFSTGFRFTLAVRLRQARSDLAGGRLFMLVNSGVEVPLAERLLPGLEYPGGRRASTVQKTPTLDPAAATDSRQLVLVQQGGSGDERSVDQTYWVSPLPPAEPVTVVIAWPAFGIPESTATLDGAAINAAAERSRLLWPPQPLVEPAETPSPPRPSTGWFAEPAG
ncbi:hypothetical protein AB0H28_20785 [Micromonospora sp. NPDC050980]|uniref:hypothetical protein n=1 Tax=Micromonospora sp. NPDC050980 TaxID=3155161 RepID=UPI0033F0662A